MSDYKILHLATGDILNPPHCYNLEEVQELFSDTSIFFIRLSDNKLTFCKGVAGQRVLEAIPKYQFEITNVSPTTLS